MKIPLRVRQSAILPYYQSKPFPLPGSSLDLNFLSQNYKNGIGVFSDISLAGATFSRGTNATMIDSTGKMVWAPHNLLLQSEQLDGGSWGLSNGACTPNNAVSPDGSLNADLLTQSGATTAFFGQAVTFVAGLDYTFSMYVKKVDFAECYILLYSAYFNNNSGVHCTTLFNLDTLSSSVSAGTVKAHGIIDAGNGWRRIWMTATCTASGSTTNQHFRFKDPGGVASMLIWGQQLNVGPLQPYYSTTSKNGFGFCNSFENAAWAKGNANVQQNLVLNSQQLLSTTWTKTGCSVDAGLYSFSDGSYGAQLLLEDSSNGLHYLSQSMSQQGRVTFSVYAKAAGRTQLSVQTGGDNAAKVFDLGAGTALGGGSVASFSITSVGDGWYRCSITVDAVALTSVLLVIRNAGSQVYQGDPTKGILLYGPQFVVGSDPATYAPSMSLVAPILYQAPDGLFPYAQKIIEDSTANPHYVVQTYTATASTLTVSVCMKQGERRYGYLSFTPTTSFNNSNTVAFFDLQAGTVANSLNTTASITSLGNGWYRCSATVTVTTGGVITARIGCSISSSVQSYQGDGSSGIYVCNAQLSPTGSVIPYVANESSQVGVAAYYGPAFDYDPVTLQPLGMRIEEQRVNYALGSQDVSTWTLQNAASDGTFTAPDGSNGTIFKADATAAAHRVIRAGLTGPAGNTAAITYSAFFHVPAGSDVQRIFFRLRSASADGQAVVIGVTGTGASATFSFVSSLPFGTGAPAAVTSDALQVTQYANGIFRLSVTTSTSTTTSAVAQIDIAFTASTLEAAAGTANTRLGIWGLQIEAGLRASSYIPTYTSQATRGADIFLLQGGVFRAGFRQYEGTIYSQWRTGPELVSKSVYTIDDFTTSNNFRVRYNSAGSGNDAAITIAAVVQGAAQAFSTQTAFQTVYKNAHSYKRGVSHRAVDGSAYSTTSPADTPYCTRLQLRRGTSEYLNGYIQRIIYIPQYQNPQIIMKESK